MQSATPITPYEAGGEMFKRSKTPSFLETRPSSTRPLSTATDIVDTDYDDESEFEEYSPKGSFETDDRRTSQTTLSSYDEVPTPRSSRSQRQFEMRMRAVEGPKGPHLFRSSQSSTDLGFDYALQMSPLFPKQPPPRTETAFSDQTVTPVTRQKQLEDDFSLATALHEALNDQAPEGDDHETGIRGWTPQQVVQWLYSSSIDASTIECFEHHDVNGVVLMDLQFEDLKELDIQSFGKRHQVWSAICDLRGDERPSPQPTPFEDTSRPCTAHPRRSPSRNRSACATPVEGDAAEHGHGKKRRGRKKQLDVITPAESVSIVAIEQLLPKPHKCAKGDRCAKWRKQQRELEQLKEENGIGRFPISPGKGGRIFVHGDPGNAQTAGNIIPNVRLQSPQEPFRPQSDAIPSVVASSDLLGPGQSPHFALHPDQLSQVDKRDPQSAVRQFLNFQHLQSPAPPLDDSPPTPPPEMFPAKYYDPIQRSGTVPPSMMNPASPLTNRSESVPPLFPAQHHQAYPAYPALQPPEQTARPHQQLRQLPRLDIPSRSATAPNDLPPSALNTAIPDTGSTICRSAVASPGQICRSMTASPNQIYSPSQGVYRLGTPASEMDVPLTAVNLGPISRDTSASVPPNMQYRPQQPLSRTHSRAADWRRPSMALPAVIEGRVMSPLSANPGSSGRPGMASKHGSSDSTNSQKSSASAPERRPSVRDPAHHSPTTKEFGYGEECTHAGWMKKRKTRMLRHEWQDAHFRLKGSELAMHRDARLTTAATDTINVDEYAVACSSVASNSKLAAAMKAFRNKEDSAKKDADATAFAFQLVPASDREHEKKKHAANGKTHHFTVKTKDDRIDWMREIMLAKAVQQKGKGYDVEVNGVQA